MTILRRLGVRFWLIAGTLAVVIALGAGALWAEDSTDAPSAPDARSGSAVRPPPSLAIAASTAGSSPAAGAPFTAQALAERQARLTLWQARLNRAQQSLSSYKAATRYPYESAPISAHPDQIHPFAPITQEMPLRTPGQEPARGVHIKTTQERVFASGAETIGFTISALDDNGKTLPLLITRAVAFDLPDPRQTIGRPQVALAFVDGGGGVFSARLQPATQGFADYAGTIRVQVYLNQNGQLGNVNFDVVYSPAVPATWGAVRDAQSEGSLDFYLKLKVARAGRYVVSGRVDDANGKPFALLSFNDEVAGGDQEIRLRLFGKLVRDGAPAFPLTLRDVQGFLLLADQFPDRAMMRRLTGAVHVSQTYPLVSFADAEWTSEERTRYLTELGKDVSEAQAEVEQLQKRP